MKWSILGHRAIAALWGALIFSMIAEGDFTEAALWTAVFIMASLFHSVVRS